MNASQRRVYFGELWPAACLAHEWDVKDEAKRRHITADCMRLVGGPDTDSTSALGPDEITALFCYLGHLGDAGSLDKSARWATCQEDYRTYNRARQADWHESKLYGKGQNKLDRDRFGGRTTAAGGPLESLDPDEVRKRHITLASRHARRRQRETQQEATLLRTPAAEQSAAPF